MKFVLEQRYLFDGSVANVLDHAHHAASAQAKDSHAHEGKHPAHSGKHPASAPPALEEASTSRAGAGETVLFVDPRVADWQALVAGVKPNVDVILLNPSRDGVTQVTQALAKLHGVKSVEFLTDGTPGSIMLGDTTLDAATLAARQTEIAGWGAHLAGNGTIVFWGCNVGEGGVGQTFVSDMYHVTGATVAASSEPVGDAALGGSWTLDVASGPLAQDVSVISVHADPFTAEARASFTGILDTPNPTVSLSLTPGVANTESGTVLLGDSLTASLTFSNGALNATGFGPYVELFAPTGVTLNGTPTYQGISLTELSATVAGGTVINPLTHASESAPTGFTDGTLYVIELPYGSFTPSEPSVTLSAPLLVASTPSLVGTALTLDARGGFEFGAVATGGANIEGSSVSASDTVELIESYATVSTSHGEGETATGPDFPVQYTVNVLAAPAVTAGDPIDNLALTLQLPSDVVWTGGALTATGGGSGSVSSASADGGTVQTVNIDYAALSGQQSITIPVYVPQNYQYTAGGETAGTPILDPSTGAPVEVTLNQPYDYSANTWNGIALGSETGNVSAASFEAKSLAVQLVANTSDAVPGEDVTYTMTFEVSDYFAIDTLALNAVMSNGLTFDPTVTPTLSVGAGAGSSGGSSSFAVTSSNTGTFNGETVQTSGGGANWSYLYNNTDGTTAVTFNVGSQLAGRYGAGTVGDVTFAGAILTKYPTATDQVTGAGGFLREGDTVSTSSSTNTAGNLYDYLGAGAYSAAVGSISDGTATPVDTLPTGSVTLQIAYVDGVAYTGQNIAPGDTVVYELVYTMPDGGNFADLSLAAYLPEPVFSALFPNNPDQTTAADYAGSGTSQFTHTTAGASALASGDYTYTLSSGLAGAGVTVSGGTGSEPSNSVGFTASSPGGQAYFNSGNQTPQTITIDLAVTASSQPFVNGLFLTAQGDSSFTPAQATTFTRQTIASVKLSEPILAVDQGVVSIVDDNGAVIDSASGVAWSNGASTAPTSVFAAAGGSTVFTSGTGPAALSGATDNLDLAGAQAGDTVRVVDAVQNTGGYAAYDVIVKDALAQGLSTTDISHLTFTLGDGTVLSVINPNTGATLTGSAAVSAFFGGTGVLVVNGTTGTPLLAKSGTTGDIVYVTYDITLPTNTPTAASLTGQASIVSWTNHDVYANNGSSYTLTDADGNDANFANDAALGAVLTSAATVATRAPGVTDSITGGTDASDTSATVPANSYPTNAATAVPGETVDLSATITLPQGQNNAVVLKDILPAGLTPVTTAGTYTVTLTPNDGSGPVDLTADASWSGQTLTLTLPTEQVNPHTGGDQASTILVTYQAQVPQTQSSAIDTSGWSSSTTGNLTRTDSFAKGNGEGLSYATTTATTTGTTTGTGDLSGVQNVVTVTNPLVAATLTETGGTSGQTVYSGETITYQLTVTNTSTTATAYDAGTTIALPTGLTYVNNSLSETSGGGTVTQANIGNDGTGPGGDAISGLTLAPGASAVLTFQATVDNNLVAGTALKVTSQPTWNSLPDNATVDGAGNVNPQAQAYVNGPGSVQNSVAAISPVLSVIGGSNDTAGLGTLFDPNGETSGTAVAMTDGEIVRMRATLQLPEGENSNVGMTVTLPSGLTIDPNYATDGSVTVLLVSPNHDMGTTLTGTGLQMGESGGGINTAKLDLGTGTGTDPVVATLPSSAITVSGSTLTLNLGTLQNNDNSALPNYVIVEFNTVVGSVAGGTSLTTAMQGSANSAATTTTHDYVAVEAPAVTVSKQIAGIVYNADGSASVTYTDTVTNSGDATAYGVNLTDPGASEGASSYTGTSGTGTGVTAGVSGTGIQAGMTSLGAGASQTFTYVVTIPRSQVTTGVSDANSTVTVTSSPLNPAHETSGQETLAGTALTPATNRATASAGLDAVSGTVNQDVSATEGTDGSLVPLAGETVSVTFTGQTGTESVQTAADGSFTVYVPDDAGSVSITAAGDGTQAPAGDVLDNHPDQATSLTGTTPSTTGTNPATLTFTPAAGTSYSNVPFDFWHALDTAPVLGNGPTGTTTFTMGGSPILLFPTGTVTDAQLGTSFGQDFSGTTLTVERYVSGTPSPNGLDLFTGAGTASTGLYLNTTNNEVLYNGTQVGTFTETGGVLSIKFAAAGVSRTTVDNVLQNIEFSFTGPSNTLTPGVTIGAQIDDANNDPIGLNGSSPDASGPHDQGPGGDLLSNVLAATVDVQPETVAVTFTEPNDANPASAPYPVAVDPTADLGDILHTATPPTQITLTITNVQPEDVLAFTNTADIQGVYASGTMTLTAVSGHSPTLAEWQSAIQSVTYYDISAVPDTATRDVTIHIADGTNSVNGTGTIAIVPVNDSPILNTGIPVTLNDSQEFQGTGTPMPNGAVGTLVSQLVGLTTQSGPANVTDTDGSGLTGGGVPGGTGVAITGINNTDLGGTPEGTWYYSTDNGASWTPIPTDVSAQAPLDLSANARVYFQPTNPNFNGQIANAITFRAWDGFDGTANGTQANLAGVTAFGQNAPDNTAATSYSIATETLPLMVDSVNNAPQASGTAELPPVSAVVTNPPGETVGQLFGGNYNDNADQQYSPTANPSGSTANSLAGIAIVGDAATSSQGVWEYSLNDGPYVPITTALSDTGALILPASAKLAFQPENGFTGTPGALTVRLIDSSSRPIATGLTGASLAADTTVAYSGVDVTTNGGSTAISAATVPLETSLIPLPGPISGSAPMPPAEPPPGAFPDDLTLAHLTGPERSFTDDFLAQPLIPELSLVGSMGDHFVIVEQHAIIGLPPNLFADTLSNAQLSYEVSQPDGSPLPPWLSFDSTTLTFYGTPPDSAVGRVNVKIVATDNVGNSADAVFTILVGYREQDVIGLITGRRPGGFVLTPGDIRELRLGDAAPEPEQVHLAHAAVAGHKAPATVTDPGPTPPQRAVARMGGFSGALHAAGPMAAVARARILMEAVRDLAKDRPAA